MSVFTQKHLSTIKSYLTSYKLSQLVSYSHVSADLL